MSNLRECLKNLQMIDPHATLCRAELCQSPAVVALLARLCDCRPPFPPVSPCPYPPGTPVTVYDETTGVPCFCCCHVQMEVATDAAADVDVSGVWVGQMVRVARRAN